MINACPRRVSAPPAGRRGCRARRALRGDRLRRCWRSVLVGDDGQPVALTSQAQDGQQEVFTVGAKTQLVRKMRYDPPVAAIACSPASLVLP